MDLGELRALIARHARHDTYETAIEDVSVSAVRRSTPPEPSMSGTIMAFIAQGAKRIALGDRVYEYGAGQYLVSSVDLPITGEFTRIAPGEPALGVGLALRPALIAELLLEADHGGPHRGGSAPPGLIVSDAPAELVDALVRLLRLLDQPRDAAVLAPMVKREIVWRLITGEQGATVRQLGLADSGLSHVARAVRWVRDHFTESFRVEDVASMFGMSASAFYRNFQTVTAMSPIQFQKQIRLQRARLLLASSPGDVTGVGLRVGYGNPSQFSREYRRQFGLSPSQDAARMRRGRTGAVPNPR